ncbi:transglycosylase SLT domain-containing protein [Colwellia sp. UCD-KL20]|uniref:transglycosylase SLT domain-containing protein n=1 Tax=Colwellia sp. UCD-KL20 TaxID=1917165 RepID=UPI0009709CB2|nr:transglycosylase SLT domain-containing protein [Colwellia sp. UCD-KL20]
MFLKNVLLVSILFSSFIVNAIENTAFRKMYLDAEKQIWLSKPDEFKKLYQQLHYYPLQPYLDQQRLMHKINIADGKEITTFLDKYKGTPLDWPLRKKWLEYLIDNKQESLFLYHYKSSSSATLNCAYYRYSLKKGVAEKTILPKVTKLWTVGKSQPKICDPLFKQWQKAGYRTESIIWERIGKAADGGEHTLLPYLTTLLPNSQKYLGSLWHKVRRNPAYILRRNVFKKFNEREAEIFTYGVKRLIWREPDKAIGIFNKLKTKLKLTSVQQKKITQSFALSLANKNHPKAQKWLHMVDEDFLNESVVQWRIADVLRKQNWELILRELDSFPKALHQTKQWQYWHSRSLIETNNKEQGVAALKQLANTRHYYGFLAAGYLNIPFNLQDDPIKSTEIEKNTLLQHSAAKRAFELFHIGKYSDARKEWNYWLSQLNDHDKLVASTISYDEKWFDRAIFTLSKVGYLNDVDLRFPLAFHKNISKYSKKNNIDPAWAFAIARRESSFMPDANSGVGAKGLMQIMLGTAKQLERKRVSTKYLLNAKNNIKLGTKYLKILSDQYKGNNVLATASYNAGPHRVKKWAKEAKGMPIDMWIETIPFKETREYVKSVMAYQQIYQHKIGKKEPLFSDLIKNKI